MPSPEDTQAWLVHAYDQHRQSCTRKAKLAAGMFAYQDE